MPLEPASSGIRWNKVTGYSKLGAIILFVGVIPALSFYIGTQYRLVRQTTSNNQQQSQITPPLVPANYVSVRDKLGEMTVVQAGPFKSELEQISDNPHLSNPETLPFGPKNVKLLLQGPIEVTGTYRAVHSGIGFDGYCMSDFDVVSLARLPSLPGETTPSSWQFCFRNEQAVRGELGETAHVVTVKIDNYVLSRYPSEVIDWADLIEVVKQ